MNRWLQSASRSVCIFLVASTRPCCADDGCPLALRWVCCGSCGGGCQVPLALAMRQLPCLLQAA